MDEQAFLTPNQAASVLNISLSTLKKLIYQQKIRTFRTPGGHHRIFRSDLLNAYESSNPIFHEIQPELDTDEMLFKAVYAFSTVVERRNRFCRGHSASVSQISCEIAKNLFLSKEEIHTVAKAALLHDIGMITVPENILNKRKMFSRREFSLIESHPLVGAEILGDFLIFQDIVPIIKQHHERPDGKGYPYGLQSRDIRIEAKIIAVAEAVNCMTAPDSYRKPVVLDKVVEEIQRCAGTQFDAAVVFAFLQWARKKDIHRASV